MPRLPKKHKRRIKHLSVKTLTIGLAVVSALISARTTYVISPFPFDDFQLWRETQMHYVFSASLSLLIVGIVMSVWAIKKGKLKISMAASITTMAIPLVWLIVIFSAHVV